ncbi:DNA helicase PcrA [Clostridium sp. D53t1_180928_C8]|uniref:DNA helicase PcrA n=1 Tax=Clostridium sp. D53t1_180928_C8 TaxID=2787101 RepID=UPI0018AC1A0A|nr:DNA helicase PcrA [Clostridium sp. D53t1_180928_C8]
MDLKSLLNKEQYEGAVTVEGPVLILAGAGSGKTRVLTHRMAHMIEDLNIFPYKILAITFTNKAAKEMQERVHTLIGDKANDMWISTFHSTCVRILRREIEKLGYKKNFTIYDSTDQKTLIKECIKILNINDKEITEQEIMGKISKAKDNMQSADSYYREHESNFREKKIAEVYAMYQKRLKENNALDFDDLICKTVELFKKDPETLDFYQRKFQYIMVDEYQDTNGAQYELVTLLAAKHRNICVVGDDDQCIYEWRGADIKNILGFEKDYPEAKVIKLEQNYRSKGNILNAANVVIVNNSTRKSKVLRTEQDAGSKIKIYRAYSDGDEGTFVANQIEKIKKEQNKQYKDFAILYRTNAQSRIFEESLRRAAIAYKIVGGTKFYDRKEIKDMLSYLKVLVNPSDSIALRRIINVPKRGIGDATIQKVLDFAENYELPLWDALSEVRTIPTLTARNCAGIEKFMELMENLMMLSETVPVSHLIETILEDTGYIKELEASKQIEDKSRIENLKELVSDAVDFEKNYEREKAAGSSEFDINKTQLEAYLEKVSLVQDTDKLEDEEDENGTVVLMTIHSAKGLEFPVVFMVGMENGIFPGQSSFNSDSEMEESRRLCYVGITRAKETLFMTSAEVRRVFGRTVAYPQSDFISEIKSDLREYVTMTGENKDVTSSSGAGTVNGRFKPSYSNPHSLRNNYGTFENRNFGGSNNSKIANSNSGGSNVIITANEATVGRKVKHDKFGEGTIVSIADINGDKKLTIAFNQQGVKMLMLSMAKLELL